MLHYDIATKVRPIIGGDSSYCGDAVFVDETENDIVLAIFDGSGHHDRASEVAQTAIRFLKTHRDQTLEEILILLHEALRGTVGCVAALCRIIKSTGQADISGIGNVGVQYIAKQKQSFVIRGGILGYEITKPITHRFFLHKNEVLFLFSDGIKAHIDYKEITENFSESADSISQEIMRVHSKEIDDAAIITVRVTHD
ncbi:MAG: SpoIIE family protein phosphatase [Gammaproteobacteria bacterium]|nr:SpoIIE family protein phosphatase [Gammaproteobacteria bacterium]